MYYFLIHRESNLCFVDCPLYGVCINRHLDKYHIGHIMTFMCMNKFSAACHKVVTVNR